VSLYLFAVYAHVLLCIFLVGYGLFWLILGIGTKEHPDPNGPDGILQRTVGTSWPPKGMAPLGVPLSGLGWLALIGLVVTGALVQVAKDAPLGDLFAGPLLGVGYGAKLAVVGLALLVQLGLALRASALLSRLFFLLVVLVIGLSALLAR
jgi:hypothetical protein